MSQRRSLWSQTKKEKSGVSTCLGQRTFTAECFRFPPGIGVQPAEFGGPSCCALLTSWAASGVRGGCSINCAAQRSLAGLASLSTSHLLLSEHAALEARTIKHMGWSRSFSRLLSVFISTRRNHCFECCLCKRTWCFKVSFENLFSTAHLS